MSTSISTNNVGNSRVMATTEQTLPKEKTLKDPKLVQILQDLRQTDNTTNFLYIARAYLVLVISIGGAIAFHQWQMAAGVSLFWNIPIWIMAVLAIGASQHQLAGATHEATHHILFKNRYLNEFVSDWLCMFPLFSSTYTFRLHHLAHHQFINDPVRDPDFSQLASSGHWMKFPVSKASFVWMIVKQLTLYSLIKYILVRAIYNSVGVDNNPYDKKGQKGSKLPMRIGILFMLSMMAYSFCSTSIIAWMGNPWLYAAIPVLVWSVIAGIYLIIPNDKFQTSRLRPVITPRMTAISRTGFIMVLFNSLSLAQYFTGGPVWTYFALLWLVPIFTSFSLFMVLRQLVQHGNGDRGWLTNTRVFLVNPFIRYAVFPFGMDYHLPHHMYATIPHYRLPKLHQALMDYPEYSSQGIVVKGYFFPTEHHHPRCPSVLEVLGPEYAMNSDDIFIDESVLEDCNVEEIDQIINEAKRDIEDEKARGKAAELQS